MLPNKLKDVRGIVLACLGEEEAAALFFSVHKLAEICNRSVLVDYVINIDKDTTVNAFTNGGEQVYSYPCQDLRPGCGNTSNLLHVHLSYQFERGGICNSFIDSFTSKEKVLVATKELEQGSTPIPQIEGQEADDTSSVFFDSLNRDVVMPQFHNF